MGATNIMCLVLASLLIMGISGCSGSTSSIPLPVVEETPPPVPAPLITSDFSAVQEAIDQFEIADMAIVIGDTDGEIFRYEKGAFKTSDRIRVASATKLITGLAVWSLVEDGVLSPADKPGDVIPFWTNILGDFRAMITLDDLMSFKSGFNKQPRDNSCSGTAGQTLEACVREIYDGDVDTQPGRYFAYGPEHMQIAALMVRELTGQELKDLMREALFDPLGISDATAFPVGPGENVRYSGSIRSTTDDYALLLSALLKGEIVSDLDGFLTDRTATALFDYRIPAIEDNNLDWHYGFGFWKECDLPTYTNSCDEMPTISSPGAFGFTPWVDFEAGYWAIIAMDENITATVRPSQISVTLEQTVQPMIEDALDGTR